VAPLRYVIRRQQSYLDAWVYKDPSTPPERNHALHRLQLLTYLFTVTHGVCLDNVSGTAVSAVALVPSLSRPGQPHALEQVAQYLPYYWTRVAVAAAVALPADRDMRRDLNPAFVVIKEPAAVAGRHVVVFDDTWTTGGHAQSLAIGLRQAGAHEVSVVVVGRDLDPQYPPSAQFIEDYVTPRAYNLAVCPVTGADCPPARIHRPSSR
jgi:hypothetical protein